VDSGVFLAAPAHTVTCVRNRRRELHRLELEPEVRNWLESLSDSDYMRTDEVAGMLAEKGSSPATSSVRM
jgi:hypothetical protein